MLQKLYYTWIIITDNNRKNNTMIKSFVYFINFQKRK